MLWDAITEFEITNHEKQRKATKKIPEMYPPTETSFSKEENDLEDASHLDTVIRPNPTIDQTQSIGW